MRIWTKLFVAVDEIAAQNDSLMLFFLAPLVQLWRRKSVTFRWRNWKWKANVVVNRAVNITSTWCSCVAISNLNVQRRCVQQTAEENYSLEDSWSICQMWPFCCCCCLTKSRQDGMIAWQQTNTCDFFHYEDHQLNVTTFFWVHRTIYGNANNGFCFEFFNASWFHGFSLQIQMTNYKIYCRIIKPQTQPYTCVSDTFYLI